MDTRCVHDSDEVLVDRARAGDGAAFAALFERHRDVAYRVAWRVIGNGEDALDAVQDAFIRAYQHLGGFAGAAAFKTWLLRIVYRRAIDLRRGRGVRRVLSIDPDESGAGPVLADPRADADPAAPLARAELGARLRAALEALPAEQRQAFVLHADGQMTYAEIAETQGVPIGTVMSRIYYARRKLRDLLADLAEAPPSA